MIYQPVPFELVIDIPIRLVFVKSAHFSRLLDSHLGVWDSCKRWLIPARRSTSGRNEGKHRTRTSDSNDWSVNCASRSTMTIVMNGKAGAVSPANWRCSDELTIIIESQAHLWETASTSKDMSRVSIASWKMCGFAWELERLSDGGRSSQSYQG